MLSIRVVNILILALVMCLFFCELCHSQGNPRRRQRNRNTPRPNQAVLPNGLQSAYHAAFNQQVSTPAFSGVPANHGALSNHGSQLDGPQSIASHNDWNRFTPSTPASTNVECYLEVTYTQKFGGHCVRLGSLSRVTCQSGMYLDVHNTQCEGILRAREQQLEDTSQAMLQTQDGGDTSGK